MKIKMTMGERVIYETDKGYQFLVLYTNQFGAMIAPIREQKYYHIEDLKVGDMAVAIDQIAMHEFKWFHKVGLQEIEQISNDRYEKIVGVISRMLSGETTNMPGIGLCYSNEAEELAERLVESRSPEAIKMSMKYFDLLKGIDLTDRAGRQYPRRKMYSGSETISISLQKVDKMVEMYDVDRLTAEIMINNAKAAVDEYKNPQ